MNFPSVDPLIFSKINIVNIIEQALYKCKMGINISRKNFVLALNIVAVSHQEINRTIFNLR